VLALIILSALLSAGASAAGIINCLLSLVAIIVTTYLALAGRSASERWTPAPSCSS
jgi:hypothetical protein